MIIVNKIISIIFTLINESGEIQLKVKFRSLILVFLFSIFPFSNLFTQDFGTNIPVVPSYAVLEKVIENGDTLFVGYIREVFIYPPMTFTSKKQEKFYWRTIRDVKIALPYARLVSSELARVNKDLYYLPDKKSREKYLKDFEKTAFKKYEKGLKKLTINQGKMLIKLIDRECEINTFDLIKAYKGNVPAFFWNTVAHFFGSSLKAEYDGKDKDRIVERVITLVDAGQL